MSWEGYYQLLCKNGHQWSVDGYDYSSECCLCPHCKEPSVYWNQVDQTNDNGDEDVVEFEEIEPAKMCTCACGNLHQIAPPRYKMPPTREEGGRGHHGAYTNNPWGSDKVDEPGILDLGYSDEHDADEDS